MRREHTLRIVQPSRRDTPGWQAAQHAAIAALHDAEESMVRLGVERKLARAFGRVSVIAFLQQIARRRGATSVQQIYEVVEDFLAVVYANPHRDRGSAS